jgi:hypothetical protein
VCLIVITVFWRGMSPVTAGPARSAEITMLASILKLLMILASCVDSFRSNMAVGC